MFHPRPCGCKGQRTCLICEKDHGAQKSENWVKNEDKDSSYVYCPLCDLAWPGWEVNGWKSHPKHEGQPFKFEGVSLIMDFISEEEEKELLLHLDEVPWDPSQSGRRKQNYGPKCNFKKHRVRTDSFEGFPSFTRFVQDRFASSGGVLAGFRTAEQCSLDYRPERGSSIDPHVDDCWIWGERIPTLSLLSDSALTLRRFAGPRTRYNLDRRFPPAPDEGRPSSPGGLVRLPMPRRSLLVLSGPSRYDWEHGVLREDVTSRRVCLTYRELAPDFLGRGPEADAGRRVLDAAKRFWDHRRRYGLDE